MKDTTIIAIIGFVLALISYGSYVSGHDNKTDEMQKQAARHD